jgi:predicted phosphoribosyltransferase
VDTYRYFDDRIDAAEALAEQLREYSGRRPLILAIPRGAVPMGKVLADRLQGELDVVLVHKLGAAFNPEYAIGAIDESGWTYLRSEIGQHATESASLREEKERQLHMLQQRRTRYTPYRHPVDPHGRIVIVVDDGIATGATMLAALHAIRAKEPAELICAAPVAAADSADMLAASADKVVCVLKLESFFGIGQFYRDFSQVSEEEVIDILAAQSAAGKA